jgi:hypothetical protein
MKRTLTKAVVLAVLAILAVSGVAQAFTPVPIPKPRTISLSATYHVP